MTAVHLVSGATGFVGGAIILELVETTEDELICLVRPGAEGDARGRFESAVRRAATAYAKEHLVDATLKRSRVLPADITDPLCGVSSAEVSAVSHVWHAAASLAFENEKVEEIRLHNVTGTRSVVELAHACGAQTFNYISTAYVAGTREGVIKEELPAGHTDVNNEYERSKVDAELIVADSGFDRLRILRPSIVVGHSLTYGATAFAGMYGFTKNLRDLQREVTKRLGNFLSLRPLRVRADPTAPLNLIPIDVLARNLVTIGVSDSDASIFHLTNAAPPPVGGAVRVVFDALGLRRPRYVNNDAEFTSIDREVDDRLEFYRSYIGTHKQFDRTNADAVTGSDAASAPLSTETLVSLVDWHLSYLLSRRARASAGDVR
jgi:nucleoside-diphosphate-sugar epimerase